MTSLMDAFRSQMAKDKTKQVYPSVPVAVYAVSLEPEYRELRCLITERAFSPGETVITCSPDNDKTGVDTQPDNMLITLRADGTFVNNSEKMAIWVSTTEFGSVCNCDVQDASSTYGGDKEVTCDIAHTNASDPGFVLSKMDARDLSSIKPSDAANIYRLYTNEGNMCRVIDHSGYVTCVTESNEMVNDKLGVYFKVVTI